MGNPLGGSEPLVEVLAEADRLRRRRRRLPLILGALAVLVLATGLGFAYSGVNPGAGLSGLLGGAATQSPLPTAAGSEIAIAPPTAEPSPAASSPAGSGSAAPGSPPAASSDPSASPVGSGIATGSGGKPAGSGSAGSGGPASGGPAASVTIAKAIAHGSRSRPVVALTFDDGYDPIALRQILAILKREKVRATFFPYGWAVSHDPAGWKMVVAAGYPIGNHTLRHTILTSVSTAQVVEEMTRGRRTIDLYSGGTSGNYMRPPGGNWNAGIARAVAQAGYSTIVLWDVDTKDWQAASAATIRLRAIRGTNGSIVLMHAGPLNTPKALPAIIANYRARGFTFVTVPELLEIT